MRLRRTVARTSGILLVLGIMFVLGTSIYRAGSHRGSHPRLSDSWSFGQILPVAMLFLTLLNAWGMEGEARNLDDGSPNIHNARSMGDDGREAMSEVALDAEGDVAVDLGRRSSTLEEGNIYPHRPFPTIPLSTSQLQGRVRTGRKSHTN
ncbi:hypothetical protein HIM_12313 [Hirsutella minnesotensis 3608]|uniref:Uncharacterized protein n=1 Tax=Hirsutella minnesotensis 3608 TaxID=1043627 RepID=A0A0F7ZQR0_9HYPO|nr:hypothetical protein HIM_12313 [Hirsutella minnesotensis 3608]